MALHHLTDRLPCMVCAHMCRCGGKGRKRVLVLMGKGGSGTSLNLNCCWDDNVLRDQIPVRMQALIYTVFVDGLSTHEEMAFELQPWQIGKRLF